MLTTGGRSAFHPNALVQVLKDLCQWVILFEPKKEMCMVLQHLIKPHSLKGKCSSLSFYERAS